jgi:quinolinate synthase
MAMNGLRGVLECLDRGQGEIQLPEAIRARAQGCIERMLAFTARSPAVAGLVGGIGAA